MQLSIAYINDVHGYLEPHEELFYDGGKEITAMAGGYAALATVIKEIRKQTKNTLLFDGGDTFHGTLPLVQSKGEAILPVLNALNFDAMVGHWDFAYGPQQLKKLAAQITYPVLAINIYNDDGSLFLQPYIIKEVEDVKIAIIGICSNIIDKTMPKHFSEGLKITDGSKELPLIIEQVKEEGADIIILLSHNGFPQDVALLEKTFGVDICLSAHTHNRLYEAVKANETIVIQCGCHGSFLGHLKVEITNKKITGHNYELLTIDKNITPDTDVDSMVKKIMEPYKNLMEEVVGDTNEILHRYNTLHSSMDELLLAAISSAADVSIAFSNGWRYGIPISNGEITKWDLYNIIPMNPVVSTVELSGEEIIKMLEENLERTFSSEAFKQMGGHVKRCFGISVKMRIENPKGHRIQQIFIGKEPLVKNKIYKAAFVTSQGVPEKLGNNRKDLEIKAVEAIEKYLEGNAISISLRDNTFSLV